MPGKLVVSVKVRPPIRPRASSMMNFLCAALNSSAAPIPAGPAPTITTSKAPPRWLANAVDALAPSADKASEVVTNCRREIIFIDRSD
jgi:hypothetical protein